MKSGTTKKSDSKKASSDRSQEQGLNPPSQSFEAFSAAETFGNYEDSRNKMGIFIESLENSPEKLSRSHILDRAFEINKYLNPTLLSEEIIDLYNTIVLYGRSYTKLIDDKQAITSSLSFNELMSQSFPKARYTLEPFFESGTVNMISAPPNTWKSWLLFICAVHIAEGTALFEKFPSEESRVMIVNEEDSFRSIQDRFNILGVINKELPIFFRVANGSKLESKFIDKLILELKEKQIKVVIFDSLRSMHEADENDSTAMQIILDQMKRIARENITVIFTHHHRKKGLFEKGSTAESSRGSSAINAAISGHLSLDEEERDTGLYLVIRHLKSKAGEKLAPFEIKIIKSEGKVEFKYDGEFKASEKKLKETKNQIMDILSDGKWKSKKDFTEKIAVGNNIMNQSLQSLKNDGMLLTITRPEAIKKSIPVTPKGNARELYYCLNTDSSELITRSEEEVNQDYLEY